MIDLKFLTDLSCSGSNLTLAEQLFDLLPDVQFFVKDREARYLVVNQTIADHAGVADKRDMIGLTCEEIFLNPGVTISKQDLQLIESGGDVLNALEMCLSSSRQRKWCLSSKYSVRGPRAGDAALVGISRVLPATAERHQSYNVLNAFMNYLKENCGEPILIMEVARQFNFSMDLLERLTRELFGVTPKQILTQLRMEKACLLLESTDMSVAAIVGACGYIDHSAFSRQFKASTHYTPQQYRNAVAGLRR
ncbi:helix-turn-helix domain-containing protein [Pseudomonas putida]|uniref:helix-turn-helix domain-containing protein n=1 Tax=Pseudomonas putida TaxID=303 RepID=UPI003F39009E